MEDTTTRDIHPEKPNQTNVKPQEYEGKSLEQIYHEESEAAYLAKFQAGVDYYMMQWQEGLI